MAAPLILLVDDNEDLREALADFLESAGFRVVGASSARQALAATRDEVPAITILDATLPDADGSELARTLKGDVRTAGTQIIVVSGKRSDEVRGSADGLYARVMRKPVDVDVLVDAVRASL